LQFSHNSITLTVIFDKQWCIGVFEKKCGETYSVAREIFGPEPTDPELFLFLLKNYDSLRFTSPTEESVVVHKKRNPKRASREARKTQAKEANVSKAMDALRVEQEKNKKTKKHITSKMREEEKQRQFEIKQIKKKQKHRGR